MLTYHKSLKAACRRHNASHSSYNEHLSNCEITTESRTALSKHARVFEDQVGYDGIVIIGNSRKKYMAMTLYCTQLLCRIVLQEHVLDMIIPPHSSKLL